MKKKFFIFLLSMLLVFIIKKGEAFQQITAQEAFEKFQLNEATLLDVRTKEECTFVGSPALVAGGDPIGYLVEYKLFNGLDDDGNKKMKNNPDFNTIIEKNFGDQKEFVFIVMCKVGGRSSGAAKQLDDLGFTDVYEIDNYLKEASSYPGGCGGFEGATYDGLDGYTGYPGRPTQVAMYTGDIQDENDSVSWKDSGLPITYKTNPDKILELPKKSRSSSSSKSSSFSFYSGYGFSGYYNSYSYNPSFYSPSNYNFSYPSFDTGYYQDFYRYSAFFDPFSQMFNLTSYTPSPSSSSSSSSSCGG